MRRRVLGTVLFVTAVAVALFGIPLAVVVTRLVDEQAVLRLERNAILASRDIPAAPAGRVLPIEPSGGDNVVFALYDTAGVLVSGTGPPTADPVTRGALTNTIADLETGEALVVAVPVVNEGTVTGAIRAQQPTSGIDARALRLTALIASAGAGVLGFAAVLGYLLAGRITRPVARLRDATTRLGTGDFAITTPDSAIPELRDTAAALASTARRLDGLVARERQLATDISHQLRTPLTALRAAVEAELSYPRPDHTEVLHEALADIDRLDRTISELLTIARTTHDHFARFDLGEVLNAVDRSWAPRLKRAHRALRVPTARYHAQPLGNATMLRHALDVLLDNALIHGDGAVSISLDDTETSVTITVADEGAGFERPLAPTLSEDHGHGLALAQRLVTAMHGRLVFSRAGPHPRVQIVLPR